MKITLTRKQLIKELSKQVYGDTRPPNIEQCTQFCDTLVDIIKDNLVGGVKVKWNGFATFDTVTRKERNGKNPKTHEPTTFPEVITIQCKFCKDIKKEVNQ